MYAITTNWTRSRLGGKRECAVYFLQDKNGYYVGNVTAEIAQKYKFKQNKRGNIVIHYGSGSGYLRIASAIKEDDKNAITLNTSIF